MKLFNYLKVFGAFTNANQVILLATEPADRQERKMLEEANRLLDAGWSRRVEWLSKQAEKSGDPVDLDAEKAAFYPAIQDGKIAMPLQYVQDFMVRRMAAAQNNTSIHDAAALKELKEVFDTYAVELVPAFTGLVFASLNWSEKFGQKPKVLLHAKTADGEDVCVRFEAAGELAQKFLNAAIALALQPGDVFDMSVEAVDPAIAKNARAGKKVADEGKYVNHNLLVKVDTQSHTGHQPKGEKFCQKPTMEQMAELFDAALKATSPEDI